MSDIRKRLEAGGCPPSHGCNAASVCLCSLVEDAADEIERLRRENARLGLAFHRAINSPKGIVPSGFEDFYEPDIREPGK